MSDPLKPLFRGDLFPTDAKTWNQVFDVVRSRRSGLDVRPNVVSINPTPPQFAWLTGSTANYDLGAPVRLGGIPDECELGLCLRFTAGQDDTTAIGTWGIALAQIAEGESGPVMISGQCPALIDFTERSTADGNHMLYYPYAHFSGSGGALLPGWSGNAKILGSFPDFGEEEPGVLLRWVQLSQEHFAKTVVVRANDDIASGGTGLVQTTGSGGVMAAVIGANPIYDLEMNTGPAITADLPCLAQTKPGTGVLMFLAYAHLNAGANGDIVSGAAHLATVIDGNVTDLL